jgi:LL-diaminopimelate aminotransferase
MVNRNPNIAKLKAGYLFPEIAKRKQQLLAKDPDIKIISLGVGDTTEPIPISIAQAMADAALELGTKKGYRGYGTEQGNIELRKNIASHLYKNKIHHDEIFINDGAKCDIGRLQLFFGSGAKIAVQDPSYPAFIDSCVIAGQSNSYQNDQKKYEGIIYLPCTPENNFFPSFEEAKNADILYICSPNNPTGTVATQKQLTNLVRFAEKNKLIILFDSAYASYIQSSKLPKSIYEIPGAEKVAIELGSFSKMAGFTGVRLGWTIIPKGIKFQDSSPIYESWRRLFSTIFNGASNIVQKGGIACFTPTAKAEIKKLITYYLKNTEILSNALKDKHIPHYGGTHSPYLWVDFKGRNSWEVFDELLNKCHLVTSPGSGFGPAGEGFIRFSAFGSLENIQEAAQRIRHNIDSI